MPLTTQGKAAALAALEERRKSPPPEIFYCLSCGDVSDILPESYTWKPKKLCEECQALKEMGWLE